MNSKWYQGHDTYIQFPKFLVHDGIYHSFFVFFFKNRILPYILFGTWSSYLCCPNVSLCLILSIYSEWVSVCVCGGEGVKYRGQRTALSSILSLSGIWGSNKFLCLPQSISTCSSYLKLASTICFFLKQGLAIYPRLIFKISFALLLLQYWWLK